jgi:hypothetical protein
MLEPSPTYRSTVDVIKEHPWLNENKNRLRCKNFYLILVVDENFPDLPKKLNEFIKMDNIDYYAKSEEVKGRIKSKQLANKLKRVKTVHISFRNSKVQNVTTTG